MSELGRTTKPKKKKLSPAIDNFKDLTIDP